jgi:predicted acylesterase/phospholipase RssA
MSDEVRTASPTAPDATGSERLQALRSEVLAHPGVQEGVAALAKCKLALVLSGGGGKGAYQAGAMLALFDCGLRNFGVIAGTSVGALNGALFHQLCRTGDRSTVLRFWSGLSQEKIMRFDWKRAPIKMALFVLGSAFAFSPGFTKALQPDVDAELHGFWDVLTIGLWSAAVKLPVLVVGGALLFVIFFLLPSVATIPSAILLIVLIYILPRLIELANRRFGLYSNAPLRALIETVDIASIRRDPPPVFCTLATPYDIVVNPMAPSSPLALYLPIGSAPEPADTVDLLVQTAAIPEVFAARHIRGFQFVDGGVADNTPILAVAPFRPEVTFVVYLDHKFGRVKDLRNWERSHLNGMFVKRRIMTPDDVADWWFKSSMFAIVPSQNLGGLFRGTMNFDAEKANALISLGYEDALRQLQARFDK